MGKYIRASSGKIREYIRILSRKIGRLFSKVFKARQICPICGNVNPPQSTFCDFCGSPITPTVVPPIEVRLPDIVVGYVSDVGRPEKSEDNLVVVETSSMYGVKPNKRVLSVAVRGIEKIMPAKEIVKKIAPNLFLKVNEKPNFYDTLSEFQNEVYNTISSEIGSEPKTWTRIGLLTSLIDGSQLIASNIGKMRVYVINKEKIDQIAGFIPRENLRAYALRLHRVQLNEGDHVLMCYDDLADLVSDREVQEVILEAKNPQKACERLMRIAKERGLKSGLSLVVARVV